MDIARRVTRPLRATRHEYSRLALALNVQQTVPRRLAWILGFSAVNCHGRFSELGNRFVYQRSDDQRDLTGFFRVCVGQIVRGVQRARDMQGVRPENLSGLALYDV